MLVRLATQTDFPEIGQIELSAGELFRGTHMAWAVGETTSETELTEALADGLFWIAEHQGSLAGFLMAEQCALDLHIREIAVSQDCQRQGIGKVLIAAALCEGFTRGCTQATLTTDRSLPWNAPYYARLGFTEIDREVLSPRLAERLAGEPNPQLRCAMALRIASPSYSGF